MLRRSDELPDQAGIDPFLLSGPMPDDNTKKVTLASAASS